ncbi:MAG TPA: hypothetical protein DCX07_11880, partial [Phycisphaerales bacterium]|nr:hypothetical protein [Phycisphaerales bacterium]
MHVATGLILVLGMFFSSAAGALYVWVDGGAKPSEWNAKQNWSVGGSQPSSGPVNGSDVQLTGTGSNGPTNQNIANLSLNTLRFDSTCDTFTVAGNAFTLTNSGTALTVDAGASALGISCHIALGNSQSWSIGTGRTFTVSGNITGSAKSLTKTGTGTLVLTGTNSYSGGTTISDGTLKGNVTSLQGNITVNGALIFDQGTNATYSSALSGNGTFTKTGEGKLKLTGDSGFSGTTVVSQGKLQVTGSLAHSVITIESGGMV